MKFMLWLDSGLECFSLVVIITVIYSADVSQVCKSSDFPFCDRLRFTGNVPDIVPKAVPTSSSGLRLYLSRNLITKIQSNAFASLRGLDLSTIYLYKNKIREIEEHAFSDVASTLSVLVLSYNEISMLLPHYFADLSALTSLDLSYNNLTSIDSVLYGLESLSFINFDHNEIVSVTEFLIRTSEDCISCMSSAVRNLTVSLKFNSLRALPACMVERLHQANEHNVILIESLHGNPLYCDCTDAKWGQEHINDFWAEPEAEERTSCALTTVETLRSVPISRLVSNSTNLCSDVLHSEFRCYGLQLEIKKTPDALTPTLVYAAAYSATDISQYKIMLAALDGSVRRTLFGPAGQTEFLLSDGIKPNTDYTICVEPQLRVDLQTDQISYPSKICKPYYAATSQEVMAYSDGQKLMIVILVPVALVFFLALMVYIYKMVRYDSPDTNDRNKSSFVQNKLSAIMTYRTSLTKQERADVDQTRIVIENYRGGTRNAEDNKSVLSANYMNDTLEKCDKLYQSISYRTDVSDMNIDPQYTNSIKSALAGASNTQVNPSQLFIRHDKRSLKKVKSARADPVTVAGYVNRFIHNILPDSHSDESLPKKV